MRRGVSRLKSSWRVPRGLFRRGSGSVMLAASSFYAMLKAMGYQDGSIYSRIEEAAQNLWGYIAEDI